MVARKKIDSNETGLSFAEEIDLGVLPGVNGADAVWYGLEPNEYDDFGGELTLLARNPINASRQRKKGSVTDLDASGGFNQDFTQINTQRILQGVMFADFREKATVEPTAVAATGYTVPDNLGYAAGQLLMASGFTTPQNNGLKLVTGVGTVGEISVSGLVVEASPPDGAKLAFVGVETAAGDIDVAKTGNIPRLTSTAFDFTTLGLIPGEWVYIGGDDAGDSFSNAVNNGFKRVSFISANSLVIDQSNTVMVVEANTAQTVRIYVASRILQNELDDLIKRRSYQIERRLGRPDTASNAKQAEYLKGAVANEFVLNIGQADKINADISFVATDNEQRTATDGVKPGARPAIVESDMFNTSTDIVAMRLSVYDPLNPNPGALFGYLTEFNLTINNNVTGNKAVGVLGSFDLTAGMFEVSAEATAYFSTVEAVQAVRNNENVQFFVCMYKANAGVVLDVPLIALGNARLDVSPNDPITLPLSIDAATAALVNPDYDRTLLWSFFDYLPTRARNKG